MFFPSEFIDSDGYVSSKNFFVMLDLGYILVREDDPYHFVYKDRSNLNYNIYIRAIYNSNTNNFEGTRYTDDEINAFNAFKNRYKPYYFMSVCIENCLADIRKKEFEKSNKNNNSKGDNKMKSVSESKPVISSQALIDSVKSDNPSLDSVKTSTISYIETIPFNDIYEAFKEHNNRVTNDNAIMMNELVTYYNNKLVEMINKGQYQIVSEDSDKITIKITMSLPQSSKAIRDEHKSIVYDIKLIEKFAEKIKIDTSADNIELGEANVPSNFLVVWNLIIQYTFQK